MQRYSAGTPKYDASAVSFDRNVDYCQTRVLYIASPRLRSNPRNIAQHLEKSRIRDQRDPRSRRDPMASLPYTAIGSAEKIENDLIVDSISKILVHFPCSNNTGVARACTRARGWLGGEKARNNPGFDAVKTSKDKGAAVWKREKEGKKEKTRKPGWKEKARRVHALFSSRPFLV